MQISLKLRLDPQFLPIEVLLQLGFCIIFTLSYSFSFNFFPIQNQKKKIHSRYILRKLFLKFFGFDKLAFSMRKPFSEIACQKLIKACVPSDE